MEKYYLYSFLIGKRIPLEYIFQELLFILLRVIPIFDYKDGKTNDTILGYAYEVVDTRDFKRLKVKIEGQQKPLMSNDDLQALRQDGKKVAVEFINPTILAYINKQKNSLEDSIKADDIHIIETN